MVNPNAFHNKVLNLFNQQTYTNIIDESCVYGDEKALSDKSTTGYTLKKGNKIYFLPSQYLKNLPIKIKKSVKIIDRTNVYHLLDGKGISSLKIDENNHMNFREFIDILCDFEHSNQPHFKLYKIMIVGAYLTKLYWRVATKVSFGKTSIIDCLRDITSNCARMDRASPAKLDYTLKFPFILLNEIANLTKVDKEVFVQFLISVGDGSNTYTKPTRKSRGSKEIYNISNLSLCLTYNTAEYFRKKGQDSFDDFFLDNVKDRYIPFKLEGRLDTDQFKEVGEEGFNPEEEMNKYKPLYMQLLEQLSWFENNKFNLKYKLSSDFKFGINVRWRTQFKRLCIYVSEYCKDQREFDILTYELYKSHTEYLETEINKEIDESPLMKEEFVR